MSYNYILKSKKVQILKHTEQVIAILDTALKINKIEQSVVSENSYEKKGIWYGFIAKVESATGATLGSNYKIFPEINVKLDSFAYGRLNEFHVYINDLLDKEGISAENIIQDEIVDKYVLIKEILMRLMCHALSINIGLFSEGQNLLNVTEHFIAELNSNKIFFKIGLTGDLGSTVFGTVLVNNFDYWLKLMTNCVNVSEIIHKNNHACGGCFTVLQRLKFIAMRQAAVFMNSKKSIAAYHDDLLPLTFASLINTYKINGFKNIKKDNIDKLTQLFSFLSEIEDLERILSQLSTITSALGWFPVLTGVLDLTPFVQRLEQLFEKSKNILKVDLEKIDSKEQIILQGYTSYTTPTSLEANFIVVAKNLNDLNDETVIKKLIGFLGYTTKNLISLQNDLGIVVIKEDKLKQLELNQLSPINSKALTKLTISNDIEIENKFSPALNVEANSKIHSLTTNSFIEAKLMQNRTSFFQDFKQKVNDSIALDNKINCCVQIRDESVKFDNTYVLAKSQDLIWTLKFYWKKESNSINVAIDMVPGLQQLLDTTNGTNKNMIVDIIFSYHIAITLDDLFHRKSYLEVLNYINKNAIMIEQNLWLKDIASFYKAKCCRNIFKEINIDTMNKDTILFRNQTNYLENKGTKMEKNILEIEQKKTPSINDGCTIS